MAKRPPSNGTKGRKSGGNTGNTVNIIHSGLFPEETKASITFKRLVSFFSRVSELVLGISSRKLAISVSKSMPLSKR